MDEIANPFTNFGVVSNPLGKEAVCHACVGSYKFSSQLLVWYFVLRKSIQTVPMVILIYQEETLILKSKHKYSEK